MMYYMKRFVSKSIIAAIMSLIMILAIFVTVSSASGTVDTDRMCSVTVMFKNDEKVPIKDAEFRIYRVADISEGNKYSLTDDFAKYSVSLENLDADGWASLAMTLSAYVSRDNIAPYASGKTNEYGVVTFENIPAGLYLITGDTVKMGNTFYMPQPFMLSLPTADENGNLIYDIPVDAKYESRDDTPETIERRVLKIWKDEDGEERPHEITVQLLRDDEIFDEVVLNAENNWRHTWTDLDPSYLWQITEKEVPADYTVSVSRTGVTFTVTNTYVKPPEPEPTPTLPPKLPQTGQLWWPVPVLAAAGFVLCITGIIRKVVTKRH